VFQRNAVSLDVIRYIVAANPDAIPAEQISVESVSRGQPGAVIQKFVVKLPADVNGTYPGKDRHIPGAAAFVAVVDEPDIDVFLLRVDAEFTAADKFAPAAAMAAVSHYDRCI
jgi:hypothetical protein